MRQVLGIAAGALGGGLLGYSQWVCSTGQCVLTGSWYGGAVLGGFVGLVLADGFRRSVLQQPEAKNTSEGLGQTNRGDDKQ